MAYVDGFVVPVPKKNLAAYRSLARKMGKVWLEHGALTNACDLYRGGQTDRHTMLLCGKRMFFYETFGTKGSPISLSTACASGATAIQLGVEAIRRGEADAALCVATDSSVNAETLALDEIAEVGPGGHFFASQRTISTVETASYRPLISITQNHGAWLEAGGKDAAQRATSIWQEALNTCVEPKLDPAIREELEAFVARRRAEGGAPLD